MTNVTILDLFGNAQEAEALAYQRRMHNPTLTGFDRILHNAYIDAKFIVDTMIDGKKITRRSCGIKHTRWINARAILNVANLWVPNLGLVRGYDPKYYEECLDKAFTVCEKRPSIFVKYLPPSHVRLEYVKTILEKVR